jgi:hypothetical protein
MQADVPGGEPRLATAQKPQDDGIAMSPENPVIPITIRAGELPLQAFVSSVMDAELMQARQEVVRAFDSFSFAEAWAFEFTPPSSEPVDYAYLRKVCTADLVIWITWSSTTEPVRREIEEGLRCQRRIIVVRLVGDTPDEETEALVNRVTTKWKWVSVESIREVVEAAFMDEIVRAMRERPSFTDRKAVLAEQGRLSVGRCIGRWKAAGLSSREASDLATDPSVGAPDATLQPSADDPLKILVGAVGAGKSLVGERIFQEAVRSAAADVDAPLPIWLRATQIGSPGLSSAVQDGVQALGDPSRNGALIVIDGADEAGSSTAKTLIEDAEALIEAWPATRVVISSRPLAAIKGYSGTLKLPLMSDSEAADIVSRFAGRTVDIRSWPQSVRNAIQYPFFGVSASVYVRESRFGVPRSRGALIRHLVARALPLNETGAEEALRRLGRLSTEREGGPVPLQEVGDRAQLASAQETGLVVEENNTVSFGLPIFVEWFAAQGLLLGEVDVAELAREPDRLDLWHNAFVVALGEASYDQSCSVIGPVVREDPGFASQVIVEAMPQWERDGSQITLPSGIEVGRHIYDATSAWVGALAALAQQFPIVRSDGSLRGIAVDARDGRVLEVFRSSDEVGDPVITLPGDYQFASANNEWLSERSASPPMEPAWPWRWSHQTVVRYLKPLIDNHALIPPTGPLFDESIWALALTLTGGGSRSFTPIPLADLEAKIAILPPSARIREGRRTIPLTSISERINELRASGISELTPPWPGWDRDHGDRFFWTLYSPERLFERTRLVYEGAMQGYAQVADLWFGPLSKRLATSVALPATLTGQLRVGPPEEGYAGGPVLRWWLESLPVGATSSVQIDDVHSKDWPTFEVEALHQIRDRLHQRRPKARRWIGASLHHQALDIFGATPATDLAFTWLQKDLRAIELT